MPVAFEKVKVVVQVVTRIQDTSTQQHCAFFHEVSDV